MKNKNKYILGVVLIFFITLINIPVVASTQGDISPAATTSFPCGHTVDNIHVRKYVKTTMTKAIDQSTHGTYEEYYWYCPFCGPDMDSSIGPFFDLISTSPHSYALLDNGHVGNTHNYTRSCASCRYEYSLNLICNGPPCVAPYMVL